MLVAQRLALSKDCTGGPPLHLRLVGKRLPQNALWWTEKEGKACRDLGPHGPGELVKGFLLVCGEVCMSLFLVLLP